VDVHKSLFKFFYSLFCLRCTKNPDRCTGDSTPFSLHPGPIPDVNQIWALVDRRMPFRPFVVFFPLSNFRDSPPLPGSTGIVATLTKSFPPTLEISFPGLELFPLSARTNILLVGVISKSGCSVVN